MFLSITFGFLEKPPQKRSALGRQDGLGMKLEPELAEAPVTQPHHECVATLLDRGDDSHRLRHARHHQTMVTSGRQGRPEPFEKRLVRDECDTILLAVDGSRSMGHLASRRHRKRLMTEADAKDGDLGRSR